MDRIYPRVGRFCVNTPFASLPGHGGALWSGIEWVVRNGFPGRNLPQVSPGLVGYESTNPLAKCTTVVAPASRTPSGLRCFPAKYHPVLALLRFKALRYVTRGRENRSVTESHPTPSVMQALRWRMKDENMQRATILPVTAALED